MTPTLVVDADVLSKGWLSDLDMTTVMAGHLIPILKTTSRVDLIAIGKASVGMARCAEQCLAERIERRLIITDAEGAQEAHGDPSVLWGEHPIAGAASLDAAKRLVTFLDADDHADVTVFLISGGASSLCAWPSPPLSLTDLEGLWNAALEQGVDITTLNMARAATSNIAGGAILRHVQSATSRSLIMVDNVVSGAAWVASGLTYDFNPSRAHFESVLEALGLTTTPLGTSLRAALERRSQLMLEPTITHHDNYVVASPSLLHDIVTAHAKRLGYRVVDMGSAVQGDVALIANQWAARLRALLSDHVPTCILGTGEVTVRVAGSGTGGRCQEFAWLMARELATLERKAVFGARASDGRDFLQGVAGAWVDNTTLQRITDSGMQWAEIAVDNDSHRGLERLNQLFEGGHTGWNLCDIYFILTT